ncbi:MAG: TonB-dependent receptor [Planctomycetota bacterium]
MIPPLSFALVLLVAAPQTDPPEDPPAPPQEDPVDASDPGPVTAFNLETMVVTPTRRAERILDVPYTVDYVDKERIDQLRTLPQALRDVPGVMVQETGPAQGSPYIRGFTGFRTLVLIDGIRLNNSVFRDGPNQYSGTIDPLSLSGIEVVKGPSSVLYGSDAIGGTVNVLSIDPTIWDRPIGGSAFVRVADAANYVVSRLELGGAIGDKTAWHLGGSIKDFGDIEAGDPSGELPNTGYDEWDGDFKVQHRIDDLTTLTFAAQHVDIDNAPRTHRTIFAVPFEGTDVGTDLRRDLDQTRTLTYVRLDTEEEYDGAWGFQSILSYHRQEELRRRERTGDRLDEQGFDVQTLGAQFTATRKLSIGRFTTGAEWYHDSVDSFLNRFADQTPADDIQGPVADDATYDLGGLFAELAFDVSRSTTLTAGARATYAAADANQVRDPVTAEQISIDDEWFALTGSIRFESRIVETDDETFAIFGGISQGFRAPNLSDLTRFDSARSDEFEIPAPGLDPEDFISYEIGLKHVARNFSYQIAGFITDGDDVIQRFPTGNVNGDDEAEVTKENVGEIQIGGIEFGGAYRFHDDWTAFGNIAWLDGQEETRAAAGEPVISAAPSRLMPLMGQLGIRWAPVGERYTIEARWIHAEDADRLSPRDEGDTTRIPPGGTPGYDIFDLLATYRFARGVDATVALENITDEDYRVHGSGQNRPGRNLVVGVRWSF